MARNEGVVNREPREAIVDELEWISDVIATAHSHLNEYEEHAERDTHGQPWKGEQPLTLDELEKLVRYSVCFVQQAESLRDQAVEMQSKVLHTWLEHSGRAPDPLARRRMTASMWEREGRRMRGEEAS